MVGFKQTLCALLLMAFAGVTVAQNNTNSPYTRYGYGDLVNQNFGNSKAMGGIAFGLQDGSQINPLNPASYTAIDSLTFLFEGGASLQNSNISDGSVKLNVKNSSFDYIAMQFRLHRRVAMSIGLLPFSNVGYNVSQSYSETSTSPAYTKQLLGDGGLHQLYVGLGVKVLNNLSIGANVSYFWGDITRTLGMVYPSYTDIYGQTVSNSYVETTGMSVRDYKLDFGIQYTQPIGKKHSVTLGAVFTPKHNLNNDTYVQTNTSVITVKDTIATFGTPNCFGAGVTYKYDDRLTVGVDYSLQKWGDVTYMNQPNAFCDRTKISVGAEYIPSKIGRNYFGHVKYRLGGYYTTPYYKTEAGERASREYGVTAGFGLPVPRSRSIVSVTAQYVRVEGLQAGMLNENILRFSIGITFNERWFFKRKVD